MKKLGYFVVHCRNLLSQPKIYRQLKRAQTSCANDYRLSYSAFQDLGSAEAFIERLKADTTAKSMRNSVAMLNNMYRSASSEVVSPLITTINPQKIEEPQINLTKQAEEKVQSPNIQEEKQENIGEEEKKKRVEEVRQMLVHYGAFKTATFEPSVFHVNVGQLYYGYFDGASKGNPGQASIGYHINTKQGKVLAERGAYIGRFRSNNQAQIIGMALLLADAYCNGMKRMHIFGDSKLAIGLLDGSLTARKDNIQSLIQIPSILSTKFSSCQFYHIKRGFNAKADRLCNESFLIKK